MGVSSSTSDHSDATPLALGALRKSVDEHCAEAARAIASADVLLVCIGAGFSADSGLPTYRSTADIGAYKERGLTYRDLCNPDLLASDPHLFYGFWGTCFNEYRSTTPHGGYAILRNWRDRYFSSSRFAYGIREFLQVKPKGSAQPDSGSRDCAGAFFVFTSNVDGHSRQLFERHEVRECHGSGELWQCGAPKSPCCKDLIELSPGFRFCVDSDTMLALRQLREAQRENDIGDAKLGSMKTPSSLDSERGSSSSAETTSKVAASARSCVPAQHWPQCSRCSNLARPAILMFHDDAWVDDTRQRHQWISWKRAVESTGKLSLQRSQAPRVLILEIGCGDTVSTVRELSENSAEDFATIGFDVTLVRVNPELPLLDRNLPAAVEHIPVACGGLRALRCIESRLLFGRDLNRQEESSQDEREDSEDSLSDSSGESSSDTMMHACQTFEGRKLATDGLKSRRRLSCATHRSLSDPSCATQHSVPHRSTCLGKHTLDEEQSAHKLLKRLRMEK
eukprot:TRINITY_DN45812_c0_g1_i1.p1 TRINITY_DN45812_c0_g1~~TRINITY_DN45812_c0_g1_i1.p1  ORF type:complete len:517 (+),score=57.33 TRINITY_DN45812_c0_g1_i1:28-1551(+)